MQVDRMKSTTAIHESITQWNAHYAPLVYVATYIMDYCYARNPCIFVNARNVLIVQQ